MCRTLLLNCLVKSAIILAQNEIRLVRRTGSREQLHLSFIWPLYCINQSYWLKFCIICLIPRYISINFFNNRYLAALSLLLINLKAIQSSQKQTAQDVLWYESGLSYFVLRSANASTTYIWIHLVWGFGSIQQHWYLPGKSPFEMSLVAENSPTSIDKSHMQYVCKFTQKVTRCDDWKKWQAVSLQDNLLSLACNYMYHAAVNKLKLPRNVPHFMHFLSGVLNCIYTIVSQILLLWDSFSMCGQSKNFCIFSVSIIFWMRMSQSPFYLNGSKHFFCC
jgi:hypothetical protein